MAEFVGRAAVATDDHDLGVIIVGVAENADGSGRSLTLSMSTGEYEPFDGWYDLSSEAGVSVPGGVEVCRISGTSLEFQLSPDAARALGVPRRVSIRLEVDQSKLRELKEGLRRIFGAAEAPPKILELT